MKQFLYFLIDDEGNSYKVENDVVSVQSSPKQLPQTPDGWQEIGIGWDRNMTKIGTVRSFTVPLKFTLDGARILRHVFYTGNIEKKVYLLIKKLELTQTPSGSISGFDYAYHYAYFYKGEVDLSTFQDDGTFVTVNIMEGRTAKQLKANEGTSYEIKIEDEDYESIEMEGVSLALKQNYIITDGIHSNLTDGIHIVGAAVTNKEGEATGFASFSSYLDDNQPTDYTSDNRYHFITTQVITDFRIYGKVKVSALTTSGTYTLNLITSQGRTINLVSQLLTVSDNFYTISFDETFDTLADEKFFLIGNYPTGVVHSVTYAETSFAIEFASAFRDTIIKSLRPSTVLKALTKKITGSENNCITTYVEEFDHLLLTSGDGVRSIPGSKIKTSLNQFFDFCKTVMGMGIGIEDDKIVIAPYEHFLDTSDPIALGAVKDLEVSYASDLVANTIKIGYPETRIDDVNGKYSFNNTHQYTTPITRVSKELTLNCPYLSDPYLIETTRINMEGKTTTDNSSDNSVFILNTEEDDLVINARIGFGSGLQLILIEGQVANLDRFQKGVRFTISGTVSNNSTFTVFDAAQFGATDIVISVDEPVITESAILCTCVLANNSLKRETYDTLEGVPTDTVFNIEDLSPKRLASTQSEYLNSVMYGFQGSKLTFQTTDKNPLLKTVKGAVTFDEDADITIGTQRLFLPIYFEFDTEVPTDLVEALELAPTRCFSFTWGDVLYKGFLMKAGISPSDDKAQSFKLLASPDTDLTNLL